ncbi:DUF92 domain-containing protein [Aspergillus candidus]|uniref:Integral membrane protein DUF92-domain-containing protein n=1 Tax=Aspergillus candidus TaxID=41067 RepID=A0A2I2FM49_ASPCN|nr:hypothetical protein BDW47DRAFT_98442 [Aspergillus candidus]PLB41717.1 hypothetical protein BDW47DRAFT_98442 [Aspergillus candidus]
MKPVITVPAILGLVYRAWSRQSLTTPGLVAAALTAVAHALHPWSAPFALLVVFYLGGTKVTKIKHEVKARLTLSASGSHGGEDARTHIQVLANSIVATGLILMHRWVLAASGQPGRGFFAEGPRTPEDLLVVGIVANYAAVAADTFSSELGILSKSNPRLITSPTLRSVPPGTNGGVTGTGLLAGVMGASIVAVASALLLPGGSGSYNLVERGQWVLAMTAWGGLGSVLDSLLGGMLQASVVDKRTGKIVEGTGGEKVLVHPHSTPSGQVSGAGLTAAASSSRLSKTASGKASSKASAPDTSAQESRRVESGADLLDNNAVNVLMALTMSVGAMGIAAWAWDVSILRILV